MGYAPRCFAIEAVLFLLAAPVLAECPAPGDLASGIAMRDDGGGVTVYRPGAVPGEVTETTLFDDNTGFYIRSVGGLLVRETHALENGETVADSVVLTELESSAKAFPVAEGRQVRLTGKERDAGGKERPLEVMIETSLRRRVLYGDCPVETIPVRLTYAYTDSASEVEYLDYLPEFGISLFLGTGAAGEAPDIYRIEELFKAPPQ